MNHDIIKDQQEEGSLRETDHLLLFIQNTTSESKKIRVYKQGDDELDKEEEEDDSMFLSVFATEKVF